MDENKYYAEGYGLQDVKKSIRFISLPPVLTIQLKRFQFDPLIGDIVKVTALILSSQFIVGP